MATPAPPTKQEIDRQVAALMAAAMARLAAEKA